MEEIIFVKRKRKRQPKIQQPKLRLETPKGIFYITKPLAELLKIKAEDGLMFAFNKIGGKAFVFKDNEEDSFKVRQDSKKCYRFTSIDLQEFFVDTFKLDELTVNKYNFVAKPTEGKPDTYRLFFIE